MNSRKLLVRIIIVGLATLFFVYGAIESRGLFLGPQVTLLSPTNGSAVTVPIILFEGNTKRTKELTINGNKIFIDTAGKFSVNLAMAPGYNIITIVATDARGSEQTTTSHIYFETKWLGEKALVEDNLSSTTLEATISSTTEEVN